jgi:predicted dehydrogenase
VDGDEAGRLYHLADGAGIKHAYAATSRYDPSYQWLAELVRDGAAGTLREILWTFRMDPVQPVPWGWGSSLATGGGVLNNILTHMLGILETVVGAPASRAMGEARAVSQRVPVLPMVYGPDGRKAKASPPTPEQTAQVEWRECDADRAFTALLRFPASPAREPEIHATVTLSRGVGIPGEGNSRLRLYGDTGTLVVGDGVPPTSAGTVSRVSVGVPSGELEPLPTPQRLLDELPDVGDDVQRKWCGLADDFVADIRGEAHRPYLTFRDGWRYQEAIDAIRAGQGWYDLPE